MFTVTYVFYTMCFKLLLCRGFQQCLHKNDKSDKTVRINKHTLTEHLLTLLRIKN